MPVIRRCAKAATVDGERYHALEEPTSLNTRTVAGIDGRQYRLGENRRPSAQPGLRDPWRKSGAVRSIAAKPIRRISYRSPHGWRPRAPCPRGHKLPLALITVNGSEKHEIFIRAGAVLLAKRDAGRFLPAGGKLQRRHHLSRRSGMQQTPRHQSWRLDRNGENAGR